MEWGGLVAAVAILFGVQLLILLPALDWSRPRRSAGVLDRLTAWKRGRQGGSAGRPRPVGDE
ncbi:hypothetical protein PX52LOC_05585 [Limnoglobus roseus]|uniref:Uncharacterized protein n=1 Tax=Limnoglobus roseus TaxID=2598579 RepID=A0A5C1AIS4_9BACT|nr:hypothetical protein PX52LOC_05585 [Limnoglobus roseus]